EGTENGENNPDSQGNTKAFDRTGSENNQNGSSYQRGYIRIKDGGKYLGETFPNRILQTFARPNFFADTLHDKNICIHSHTNGKDKGGNAGQREGGSKAGQGGDNKNNIESNGNNRYEPPDRIIHDHEKGNQTGSQKGGLDTGTDRIGREGWPDL